MKVLKNKLVMLADEVSKDPKVLVSFIRIELLKEIVVCIEECKSYEHIAKLTEDQYQWVLVNKEEIKASVV